MVSMVMSVLANIRVVTDWSVLFEITKLGNLPPRNT
jgi:hypothetical protein